MQAMDIFSISDEKMFKQFSLTIFKHQYENNKVYQRYCNLIGVSKTSVTTINDIPFLPIEFFKTHTVTSSTQNIQKTFTSSGTTGQQTSKHYVTNLSLYEKSYLKGFNHFYGAIEDYCVLALLPAYLERTGSSLVYMANDLIERSKHSKSGFYLNNLEQLITTLEELEKRKEKTLLIGVSFALLDLIEKKKLNLKYTTVMETGGMKGRRKEIIRTELHETLKNGFGVNHIHSEYGMTELLSQAYSKGNGLFKCPNWMQIRLRNTENPLESINNIGKTGGINIIDLANINSCSFIATQDLGKMISKNEFEILGRFDNSDIRGCNLMAL